MEPPEPEVPIESQVLDEALDEIEQPLTPKDLIQEESGVPESFEKKSKSLAHEQ